MVCTEATETRPPTMSAARLIVFLVVALAVIAAGYRVYLAADWVVDRCGAPIAAWWRRGLGEAAPAAPVTAETPIPHLQGIGVVRYGFGHPNRARFEGPVLPIRRCGGVVRQRARRAPRRARGLRS